MRAGRGGEQAEMAPGRIAKDISSQGAFAGAADAGEAGEAAQRNAHGEILQIMVVGVDDGESVFVVPQIRCAHLRTWGVLEVGAGHRSGITYHLRDGTGGQDLAAVSAGPGSDVE